PARRDRSVRSQLQTSPRQQIPEPAVLRGHNKSRHTPMRRKRSGSRVRIFRKRLARFPAATELRPKCKAINLARMAPRSFRKTTGRKPAFPEKRSRESRRGRRLRRQNLDVPAAGDGGRYNAADFECALLLFIADRLF